jgi:signal transduction histidine kinase
LRSYVNSLKRLWSCSIDLSIGVSDAEASLAFFEASKPILAEAVANAVVHGKATHIALAIAKKADTIALTVKDNGIGLQSAAGVYDHTQLAAGNIGPRSLRERVAALGGSLRLATSERGVELQVMLPASAPGHP